MVTFDIFSKRDSRANSNGPDVYIYDTIPSHVRIQIVHIFRDGIGTDKRYGLGYTESLYKSISEVLCREYGKFELTKNSKTFEADVTDFFLHESAAERAIDVIELAIRRMHATNGAYRANTHQIITPVQAEDTLNARLKEAGIGYQYESGKIFRVDSQYIHDQAVKPALKLLTHSDFAGVNEEFLNAHEHFRHGRNKESLNESLKAFESTMKAICKIRGWTHQPNDTAKALIAVCIENGLIPKYLESQITSIRTLFESGIPAIRNKKGGHGQGAEIVEVPEMLAKYALNLTATTIVFLFDCHNSTR